MKASYPQIFTDDADSDDQNGQKKAQKTQNRTSKNHAGLHSLHFVSFVPFCGYPLFRIGVIREHPADPLVMRNEKPAAAARGRLGFRVVGFAVRIAGGGAADARRRVGGVRGLEASG